MAANGRLVKRTAIAAGVTISARISQDAHHLDRFGYRHGQDDHETNRQRRHRDALGPRGNGPAHAQASKAGLCVDRICRSKDMAFLRKRC